MMRKVLLAIYLYTACVSVIGQDLKLSLQVDTVSFREFADTLEELLPVRFYYDEEWIDNLAVEERLRREMKFDPDLWIVDIEDRRGRDFLTPA